MIALTSKTLDTDIKSIKKAARKGIEKELFKRVETIIKNGNIKISFEDKLIWNDNPIARLKKGSDYLNPTIEIIADDSLDLVSKNKLNNGNFIKKAPKDIIDKEKELLKSNSLELDKLKEIINTVV